MFEDICQVMYSYIMDCEFLFLRYFKINPFEMIKNMSLLDLVMYIKELDRRNQKDKDSIQKKDIEKVFVQLRDLLIFLTCPKPLNGIRI